MTISWRIKTTRVWSHHFCKKSPWDWTGFPSQDLTRLQYDSQAVFSSESPAGNLLRSSLGSGQNPTAQELQLFLAVTWRLPSPSPGRPWPLATWILQHSHLLHHAHGKSLWFSLLGRWRHWEPMSLPLLDILWFGGEDLWGTRFSKIPSPDRIYLSFSQRLCNHNLRFLSRSHCLNLSSYCPLKKHSFQKSPSPASFLFNSSSIS